MSSSTSGPEPVAALAAESFRALERDAPAAFERLRAQLEGQSLTVDLGDDAVAVQFGSDGIHVRDEPTDAATVRLATDRRTIGELLAGRLGLAQSVDDGSIRLVGELDDLLIAHDGLRTYLHAAVRTDSVPPLIDRLTTS